MIDFTQPVYARMDGSYVVTFNGLPYHVLPTDPLFDRVTAWIAAGGQTQDEPPPPAPPAPTVDMQLASLLPDVIDALIAQVQGTATPLTMGKAQAAGVQPTDPISQWQALRAQQVGS